MKSKIVAITVGEYYLQEGVYCIKNLTIGHRKDGTPFWHVQSVDWGYTIRGFTVERAMEISTECSIPYFIDIKGGQPVKPEQKVVLAMYGVTV